jgi:hypothetical protein
LLSVSARVGPVADHTASLAGLTFAFVNIVLSPCRPIAYQKLLQCPCGE